MLEMKKMGDNFGGVGGCIILENILQSRTVVCGAVVSR